MGINDAVVSARLPAPTPCAPQAVRNEGGETADIFRLTRQSVINGPTTPHLGTMGPANQHVATKHSVTNAHQSSSIKLEAMRGVALLLVASCTALALFTAPAEGKSNKALNTDPSTAIKELITSGKFEEGLALADHSIKATRNNGSLYFLKGRIRQEQKQNLDAFHAYSIAIFLRPDMVKAYINRGLVRGALMDLAGAIEDFNSALRLEPNNQAALVNRGVTHASLNNIPKALKDLDKAISLNGSLSEAFVNRGIVRHLSGEQSRSCEDWEKAARLGSQDASEWAKQLCAP